MKGTHFFKLTNLLKLAALFEIVPGLLLILYPSLVAQLLLSSELTGASIALGRVTGFGLFSLGLACWPSLQITNQTTPALRAILTYGILITIYLVYLGIDDQWVGWMLWPAAILHAILTLLLLWRSIWK